MVQKATELEEKNKDLESNIELVISAKQNLEKMLKNEKNITNELKKQVDTATPETQNHEDTDALKSELESANKKNDKFGDEVLYMNGLIDN